MKYQTKLKSITASVLAISSLSQAAVIVPVSGGSTTSDWDRRDGTSGLPDNWRIGGTAQTRTPSAADSDSAIINGNRIIQVTTVVSTVAGEVRINNTSGSGNQGNLEINSGGSLTTGLLRSTGTDGGNLTVQGTGILSTAAAQIQANSTFNIIGSNAAFSADSLLVSASGTINFEFDSLGITTLANSGFLTIDAGAALGIDGSSYTGGAGIFNLIDSSSLTNVDEFAETISGFTGFNTDVVYDGTGGVDLVLTAVPEPSSSALLALGGIALCVRRRK